MSAISIRYACSWSEEIASRHRIAAGMHRVSFSRFRENLISIIMRNMRIPLSCHRRYRWRNAKWDYQHDFGKCNNSLTARKLSIVVQRHGTARWLMKKPRRNKIIWNEWKSVFLSPIRTGRKGNARGGESRRRLVASENESTSIEAFLERASYANIMPCTEATSKYYAWGRRVSSASLEIMNAGKCDGHL